MQSTSIQSASRHSISSPNLSDKLETPVSCHDYLIKKNTVSDLHGSFSMAKRFLGLAGDQRLSCFGHRTISELPVALRDGNP